ncbi:hypothetical protein [Streptomyces sp. NPDC018972]|uniref:hypothetical protein n=1 Tax=Streptomyces sp. NPDC018972 TaxID=3365060 RepID=UPI0037A046BA
MTSHSGRGCRYTSRELASLAAEHEATAPVEFTPAGTGVPETGRQALWRKTVEGIEELFDCSPLHRFPAGQPVDLAHRRRPARHGGTDRSAARPRHRLAPGLDGITPADPDRPRRLVGLWRARVPSGDAGPQDGPGAPAVVIGDAGR